MICPLFYHSNLSFERLYLMKGLNLMIAKSVKSADFADFDAVFVDFNADFTVFVIFVVSKSEI